MHGDLIERLERATGPDQALDERIRHALFGRAIIKHSERLDYTSSLDAALALVERVLPGTMWRVGFDPDDGSMKAELVTAAPECVHAKANHDHAPIAVLIALLRALKMEGGR